MQSAQLAINIGSVAVKTQERSGAIHHSDTVISSLSYISPGSEFQIEFQYECYT